MTRKLGNKQVIDLPRLPVEAAISRSRMEHLENMEQQFHGTEWNIRKFVIVHV